MICDESINVTVNSYNNTPDDLGQLKRTVSSTRTISMYLKVYKQTNVDDPRFVDADFIGLTEDKAITENDTISFSNKIYNIMQIIPTRRYTRVLLKLWK